MKLSAAEIQTISKAEARRVAALRMQMVEQHPFWGYLLMQVRLVQETKLECFAATDCIKHIWYNPILTQSLQNEELGFVLAHEVGHHIFESMERRKGRDHHLWNCATDYAINRIVSAIPHPYHARRSMYSLPNGEHPILGKVKVLMNHKYDGLIAEAIYERLIARKQQAMSNIPESTLTTIDLGELGELTVRNHQGGIDVHIPAELTEEQREQLRERVGQAVSHWRATEKRGHTPAGIGRTVEEWGKSRVPWRRLLHRYIGQAVVPDEYSLNRPNRRYAGMDVVVPGLVKSTQWKVVVAVDTSGSISEDMLRDVGGELCALKHITPDITVVTADAKVQEVIAPEKLPEYLTRFRMKGGGGTDHRPVFEWLNKECARPDLFVGLTDLYSAFPEQRPKFPVLWVVPEAHGNAPWGKVLEV